MVIRFARDRYAEDLYLVGILEKARRLRKERKEGKERKKKREENIVVFLGSVYGSLTISLHFSWSKTQKGARLN